MQAVLWALEECHIPLLLRKTREVRQNTKTGARKGVISVTAACTETKYGGGAPNM